MNCDVPLLLNAVRENRLDYAALLPDTSTLVERVFLFYPEEDSEDEEETLYCVRPCGTVTVSGFGSRNPFAMGERHRQGPGPVLYSPAVWFSDCRRIARGF